MAANNALQKVGLSANIAMVDNKLTVKPLTMQLDASTVNGIVTLNNKRSGRIAVDLNIDKLNVDDYLPPPTQQSTSTPVATKTPAKSSTTVSSNAQTPLFDTAALKAVDADLSLEIGRLEAQQLVMTEVVLKANAYQGLLALNTLSAKAYKGDIKLDGQLDVRGKTPLLAVNSAINKVDIHPIVDTLTQTQSLYGLVGFNSRLTSRGQTMPALENNLRGNAQFTFTEGYAKGANIEKTVCQAIAALNGDPLSGQWPAQTTFNDISGELKIKGLRIDNSDLSGGLKTMLLRGSGVVDLGENTVDYALGLKISGDDRAEACRVNERYKDIYWPLRCSGELSENPAALCGVDRQKMAEIIKDLAANEVKRKAGKAIDGLLNKWLKR